MTDYSLNHAGLLRFVLTVASVALFCAPVASATEVRDSVKAASDDVHVLDAATLLNQTSVAFGNWGPESTDAGLRFSNVVIPPAAVIDSAKLLLTAYATTTATVPAVIRGEDTASATAFSTGTDFSSRYRTADSVIWNLDSNSAWTADDIVTTPNIAAVIQHIINRPDWSSGNAIVLFIENNGAGWGVLRRVYAREAGQPDRTAKL
ncbi:MAG: hypothetical protein D6800_03455, partial [Candidatus Zixiibacteriota bacterium]